ncbi:MULTISPECIES: 3-carboxy-cis,cis-muconate cycloisomerase [Buttiauxella]|jgi:3-carboxy-cis,cis-muconate cycloisomerase|uniref:3-carboxy-cis,cis-muconate cycloisomerase n=1 Tax=Buttiauxella TaxID=82976 RepID=UPI00105B9E7A|nr:MULTISPECIES: 3-carboxy-cis,cis-muconate cycloisomerase [Buttiauxella]TDN54063.1 3-carboxy-cis,cis-muconate cycloisomerase [Buttiauxella sp. JUb87]UNK59451.1 3-carboxy-cis,cis-muconate cycloisomerase [Buttiauxella ferragutiae]
MTLFNPMLRASPLSEIFSDHSTLQGMLDFEAALARATALCGAIPESAVQPIAVQCQVDKLDVQALAQAAAGAGNLAIPLVKQLTACVKQHDEQAARYVHWGATSQDVIDSGLVLQLRAALVASEALLGQLISALIEQIQRHQHSVMPGRTWMQHALPITFGLKLAGTLDALLRWQQRLHEMKPRVLVLQFGGAAGTLASLKEQGINVSLALANVLALNQADTPWHSQRDRLLEVGAWFAGVSTTLGKFANDFSLLMQTEVAEVGEPIAEGRGGSSTMPHKRNPVSCAAILTATTRIPGLMATLYASQNQQHERALGGWQAEWETLPELITLSGGVMQTALDLIGGMQVNAEKMRANLDITHGLIMAESVTLALATSLGKQAAHHLVEQLCHRALDENQPLAALLAQHPQVASYLSLTQIEHLLDPQQALGSNNTFINQVLARAAQQNRELV